MFNFSHFIPQASLHFEETYIFQIQNCDGDKPGISEILTFVICYIASKMFGKIILKP